VRNARVRSLAELTCQELVELVTDYLDGALAPADRARFEAHLAECEGCANHLSQLRDTIAALGALREHDVAPAARAALLRAFRDFKRP
jgi:anti-sigma factor RsiW